MQPNSRANSAKKNMGWLLKFAVSITLLLMFIGSIILMFAAINALFLEGQVRHQAVERSPAGTLERVVQVSKGLALVETDMGFYSVAGGVALKKGEPLTMVVLADHSAMLCTSTPRCMRIDLERSPVLMAGGQIAGGQHE